MDVGNRRPCGHVHARHRDGGSRIFSMGHDAARHRGPLLRGVSPDETRGGGHRLSVLAGCQHGTPSTLAFRHPQAIITAASVAQSSRVIVAYERPTLRAAMTEAPWVG